MQILLVYDDFHFVRFFVVVELFCGVYSVVVTVINLVMDKIVA